MKLVIAFLVGLAFGLGLLVSGMSSPDKVLGFLDIAGSWNPALAFVMGGAVATATPLFLIARRRKSPIAGGTYDWPDTTTVDRRLVAGSAIFGIGWGLAGICPGPAVVNLVLAPAATLPFFIAMVAGILVSARLRQKSTPPVPA